LGVSTPHGGSLIGLYLAIPLSVLLALAQTTLMGHVTLLGVRPNLLLLFATAWVLRRGLSEGILMGLLGGVLLDVSTAAPFGTTMLSMLAGISLAALGEINVFQGAWYLKYLVIAAATLVFNLVFIAVLRMTGYPEALALPLARVVLPELAVHLALMPMAYALVKWLCNRITPPAVEL